jgi:crotonobetaine/carnitine-CoA ligase
MSRPESADDAANPLELIAAVPRPQGAEEFERRFGLRLTEFYGSTEANLPIGIPFEGAGDAPPRSCGRALPGWECRVADGDGEALPDGKDGQLLVRPGMPGVVSSGYWGEPEKTVELWRDLWIQTGDLMRRDEDGWFHYVDRLKDAIRVSGENVASADVEAAVAEFAGVAEVGAFGVSSELGEQDIMVAVVVANGDGFDPSGLRSHCESRLPYFAVPRYFVCDPELPRTPTERIRKVALRERGITAETVDLGRPRRPR